MKRWIAMMVSSAALAACGPATPSAATPDAPGSTDKNARPSLKLAHFTTGDEAVGFVFDQTGATPKLRMDGSNDIVELTPEIEMRGPFKAGTAYWTPGGDRVLYIDRYGHVTLYTETGPQSVYAKGKPSPLGTATVTGQYTPPKSNADLRAERYSALAIRTKMSGYQPEDSGNLKKVALALAQADRAMFVQFVGSASRWVPASPMIGISEHSLGVGKYTAKKKYDPKAKGLEGFGATIDPHAPLGERGRLTLVPLDGFPKPLAHGTPGVIWEVNGSTAVFVTLDGGRYHIALGEEDPFAAGLPPVADWPKPLQHSLLDDEAIEYFAKAKIMTKATEKSVLSHFAAYGDCTEAHWKEGERAMDALDDEMADEKLTWADRQARLRKVARKYRDSVEAKCKPHIEALEKALLNQIDRRDRERLRLYEATKKAIGG